MPATSPEVHLELVCAKCGIKGKGALMSTLQHDLQLPWILDAENEGLPRIVGSFLSEFLVDDDLVWIGLDPEPNALGILLSQLIQLLGHAACQVPAVLCSQEVIPAEQHCRLSREAACHVCCHNDEGLSGISGCSWCMWSSGQQQLQQQAMQQHLCGYYWAGMLVQG